MYLTGMHGTILCRVEGKFWKKQKNNHKGPPDHLDILHMKIALLDISQRFAVDKLKKNNNINVISLATVFCKKMETKQQRLFNISKYYYKGSKH